MGLQNCQIRFDNQWGTYYAGQTVNGFVDLIFDSPKEVRAVNITFKGEANTHWSTQESASNSDGKSEDQTVNHNGHEEYFKTKYSLIGHSDGDKIIIPAGHHNYPFTCVLPPTLPSSFEGKYGYVRYTVKVVLDRPWKFDQDLKAAFTVISPVDLNINPRLREPTRITLEKFFCCCWCKSGPLTCVVSLAQTGYVPGQVIAIVAELDNISNVEVVNVQFALQKVVTYHSQTPNRDSKKDTVVIAEIKVGPIGPHGSNTYHQPLQIPSLPPSNLTNCSLIDLDYEIKIEVIVAGFHQNMDSKIPITLGTIPFTGPVPQAPPADSVVVNMGTQNNNPNIGWFNPGPPTFTQSQFGTHTIQDKNDNQYTRFSNNNGQYNPMYPYFNGENNM